jgi:ribosomal protein S18 acetylase RimI-like enzyme
MHEKCFQVVQVFGKEEKSKVTNNILRKLPKWFGIEESIVEYVNDVQNTIFLTACDSGKQIGFISIKINNEYTAEIFVMGILKEYHNKGIGKKLMNEGEKILRERNYKYLMVKTLGESHPDINYKKTRAFYSKVGFYPLEEITEIWGKATPCLLLVKNI